MSKIRRLEWIIAKEMEIEGINSGIVYDVIEYKWYYREGAVRYEQKKPIGFQFISSEGKTTIAYLSPTTGRWLKSNVDLYELPGIPQQRQNEILFERIKIAFPKVKRRRKHDTSLSIVNHIVNPKKW